MDKYVKKAVKFAGKRLAPDRAHAVEMFLTTVSGITTITEIDLEFVNYCNLRCKWCSLDHAQEKSVMSEELLRKFFDNLLSDTRFRGVQKLNLFNGGEILLHPRLVDMLAVVRDYKRRFLGKGRPFPVTDLLTNGVALNGDLARKLIDLDTLDLVRFSIDGGSPEKYEEIRKGAKWDAVAANIREFTKINNGKVRTGIICIIEPGRPKDTAWMSDEFRQVCGLVDHLELRYPHDWMGDVKVEGYAKIFRNYCKFLFHSLVLLPDGGVVVCCGDLNGRKGTIGNLNNSDLFSIYSCKERRDMRYAFLRGRRHTIELCRDCGGYC